MTLTQATLLLLILAALLGFAIVLRLKGARDVFDPDPHGDWPHLPRDGSRGTLRADPEQDRKGGSWWR